MAKRDSYNTPNRECSHVMRGCCPICYDPCGLLKSTKEFRRKMHNNTTTQEEGAQENG